MAEAQVNGAALAWQQIGDGPDLVLVHGLGASRAFWFPQYALPLARHFRVTLFDLRGHGYSSRPESGYDAGNMAEDLAGLLDTLDIKSCGLVGHSYGGSVALEFAGRHPNRVRHLSLLDSKINSLQPLQLLSDYPHLSPFEKDIARRFDYDWNKEEQVGLLFLEVLARWRIDGGESSERDAFTPFGEGRGAIRSARRWLALLDETEARNEFMKPGLTAEQIAALPMPIQLIYGDQSRCLPSCKALEKLLPDARIDIINGGGHFFPISHQKAVLAHLQAFVDPHYQIA